MLSAIEIKDLAVIEKAEITFGQGLNIITGETGAGKSILVKALSIILGQKVDPSLIRSDKDHASVSAEFLVPKSHEIAELSQDLNLTSEDDDDCECSILIRRSIFKNGRSKAWVNDQPVTLATLRTLVAPLIDLFSQHESHSMLNPNHHIEYLDKFLASQDAIREFRNSYNQTQETAKRIAEKIKQLSQLQRDEDYLLFRYKEFEALNPSKVEFEGLKNDAKRAEDLQDIQENLASTQNLLEQTYPLSKIIAEIKSKLKPLSSLSKDFGDLCDSSSTLMESLNDFQYQCTRSIEGFDRECDLDIDAVQGKISEYQNLIRKTGSNDIDELLERYKALASDIELIETLAKDIQRDLASLAKSCKNLRFSAQNLRDQRLKAAKIVEKSLENELKSLVMPNARVKVSFEDAVNPTPLPKELLEHDQEKLSLITETLVGLNSRGSETATFQISANPGEDLKPLHKVASGGELSRIMLALKKALAVGANTCVLVFDEIDTGISGGVADVVGKKLDELSTDFQIICISHLPQVAVYADAHFRVAKTQKKKSTSTEFSLLNTHDREEEVARLLSGNTITSSSLKHARNLISRAQQK